MACIILRGRFHTANLAGPVLVFVLYQTMFLPNKFPFQNIATCFGTGTADAAVREVYHDIGPGSGPA